jgi:hypothetical protein
MAVTGIQWFTAFGYGSAYHTVDVNVGPGSLGATVSLNGTSGGGTSYAGIKSYRKSSGQNVDFGDWPSWPAVIFDNVSLITFGVATGSNQEAWSVMRVDYWA